MKILHISHSYAPVGGAEYYIHNVCNELEKQGHTNIIIYGHKHSNTWTQTSRKIFYIEDISDFGCSREMIDSALSIVKEEDPDIIYLHITNNALLTEELIELKPVISYVHNHNLYCPAVFSSTRVFQCSRKFCFMCFIYCIFGNCRGCRPFNALRQFKAVKANLKVAKKLNAIIVASGYMKQRLIENGIDKEKIYVIPYFVYNKRINDNHPRNDRPIILFVGRICKFKGLQYLLKALKYIRSPFKLIIAGDGYYINNIRRLSKRSKVDKNIEFRGWLSQEELEDCYTQASLLVMPSIWPEPFGIVGIEAASYAKPMVAFDVWGVSEWLKDGINGFLIQDINIYKLAEKIRILLTDAHLAKTLGERAKQIAEKDFMPQNHITKLMDLFLRTIKAYEQ